MNTPRLLEVGDTIYYVFPNDLVAIGNIIDIMDDSSVVIHWLGDAENTGRYQYTYNEFWNKVELSCLTQ